MYKIILRTPIIIGVAAFISSGWVAALSNTSQAAAENMPLRPGSDIFDGSQLNWMGF